MNKVKERHIKAVVDNILSQFYSSGPVNILSIISSYGFEYQEIDLENDVSGALVIQNNKKLICVRKSDKSSRKRFSVAHELGHYLLHHVVDLDLNKAVTYLRDGTSSNGIDAKEIEANYFAACILMPEIEVKKKVNYSISFDDNVEQIANHLNVSMSAMTIRLTNLGYS